MNKYYIAANLKPVCPLNKIVAVTLTAIFILFYTMVASSQELNRNGGPFFSGDIIENERTALDALPPVITYTPLGSTCNEGNRTLIATITDADGVPTSGTGLPVLYWKVNSGGYAAATGVSLGSGQYQFTFGGFPAIAGNIISYYIVAQDNNSTPNVVAQPSAGAGGYTADPPAAATPPTTPDFYVIQNTLATGTYLVGAGQIYTTITDAVNAYNNSCLNGPVTFALIDASYSASETFPILIYNPAASATNTLTIKPNTGITTSITGNAESIFRLNGADYITIDGSNNGTSSRNLTITNNSTSATSTVIWLTSLSASNGATNNTIKNCTIVGNAPATTYAGIASTSSIAFLTPAETANSNNNYQNNSINTAYYGIFINGPATGESGTVIQNNLVGITTNIPTKKIGYRGIFIANQIGMTIRNNQVAGISSTVYTGAEPDASGGIIVSGLMTNGAIFNNRVNDILNTNTGGGPVYGISLQASSTTSGLRVHNNFIYDVRGFGNGSNVLDNGHGITVLSGGGYGIYYNSINLYNNQTVPGTTTIFYIGTSTGGTIDLRNNIFSNRQNSGTRYAIYNSLTNTVFSNINFNDYYSAGILGFQGVPRATIGAWQAATGSDGNSVAVNPPFISNIDLHQQLLSPLNDQGTPISGITTDFDNDTRSATVPDIGADEFVPGACSSNIGGTASASSNTICVSGAVILSSTGFSFGSGIAYQWESSVNNVTFNPIPGETNPISANPPSINVTTYYRLRVTCSAGVPNYSNTITVTVNSPLVVTTTPGSRCGPGTVTLGATGNAGTVINWFATPTGGSQLATGTSYTTPSISSTTTYYVEAKYVGSEGAAGPLNPTAQGGTISVQFTSWQVYFNVLQSTTLVSVDVFPLVSGQASILEIYNSVGTVVAAIPYSTTVSGGATVQTIPINVFLPAGNGYYLYASGGLPPDGLNRNITGAVYPYNSTDISITGNAFDQTFFMCYYNWKFSNGCSSNRTPVVASIISPPPISVSATPATICAGSSSTLLVTSAHAPYNYTWTPGPLSGASVSVTPATNTTYTVTANDGSCITTGTVSVAVASIPQAVNITPATSVLKCINGAPVALTASGGAVLSSIFSENFESGLPTGWTITNNPVATPAAWTQRTSPYVYAGAYTFRSNDNSKFYLANSDLASNGETIMRTAVFSLVGYTNASLNFWHHYTPFDGPAEGLFVERSANGTSGWVTLYTETNLTAPFGIGSTTGFVNKTVNLDAYAGQATNYIRFRYKGQNDFWWAIDNVSVSAGNGSTPFTWSPTAGLFTNAAGTIAYTGTAAATVYANPAATTTYTATATSPNLCTSSSTVEVAIRPLLTGTISGSTTICPSASANLSIALTGTGPWTFTYTANGASPVTVTNTNTNPYTFSVSPAVTTTYAITALTDANCTALPANISTTAVVSISPTLVSTWIGLSTDWEDPNNWCGGVPTASKDVVIPNGPSIFPVITTATPVARDISIGSSASVTINSGGIISFSGNVTNDGTITNNGTIVLNGTSAQSFPGGTTGTIAAMNILEVNKSNGTGTFNKKFRITGILKPTAGVIAVSDTITIHSDAAGTASIDKVGATASFSYGANGRFTVERYIPTGVSHGKSWQLLSAPTFGQTVKAAWQEGAVGVASNPKPGYGTTMTSNVAGALAAGFDFATPSGSTIKTYNDATNAYDGIPNTTSFPIANPKGYMLFVRGDRSVTAYNAAANTTILRTTGKIYSPGADAPPSSTVLAGKFQSIGNPYASAIDFVSLLSTSTGLNTVYYVWDPLLPSYNGYGAYQTISSASGWKPVPGGTANYNAALVYSKIQSGQAFFVFSTAGGTVNFSENNKVSGSQQVFRPDNGGNRQFLRLYLHSADGNLADGNVVAMDDTFDNAYESNDADKLVNFGENFGILHNGETLAIDARKPLNESDTIFYTFSNLRTAPYQLRFAPENMQSTGLQAFLVDQYTRQQIPVSLTDSSYINVAINNDAASKAADRFYLIFRQLIVVPVTFTSVDAVLQDQQVKVSWMVDNELNIRNYDVEKSADGRNFSIIGNKVAKGNTGGRVFYELFDTQPFSGYNYYRIRSNGAGGEQLYSRVVKVWVEPVKGTITVYPNPVTDNLIRVQFSSQAKGTYRVNLLNATGQLVYNKTIVHSGGSASYVLVPVHLLPDGIYALDITLPDGRKVMEKLVIE